MRVTSTYTCFTITTVWVCVRLRHLSRVNILMIQCLWHDGTELTNNFVYDDTSFTLTHDDKNGVGRHDTRGQISRPHIKWYTMDRCECSSRLETDISSRISEYKSQVVSNRYLCRSCTTHQGNLWKNRRVLRTGRMTGETAASASLTVLSGVWQ